MFIFLIKQSVNRNYDTYNSAVVCCDTEEDARNMHPSGMNYDLQTWCKPEDVKVFSIGVPNLNIMEGVICASFNAG